MRRQAERIADRGFGLTKAVPGLALRVRSHRMRYYEVA